MTPEVIVAIIGAGTALLAALVTAAGAARKSALEELQALVKAQGERYDELKREYDELKREVQALREENAELRRENAQLKETKPRL